MREEEFHLILTHTVIFNVLLWASWEQGPCFIYPDTQSLSQCWLASQKAFCDYMPVDYVKAPQSLMRVL